MPWRPGPQAALYGLVSVVVLTEPRVSVRAPAVSLPPSIDNTLTRDADGCAAVGTAAWHPLSGVDYTGRLRMTLPPHGGGAVILYIGDSLPLDVEASDEQGDPLPLSLERLTAGPGVFIPPDFWLEDGSPVEAPQQIARAQLDASFDRARSVTLSLGRRAPRVLARLTGYTASARVAVCALPVADGEYLFATGWYGEERDAEQGTVRWMREHGAVLIASPDGRAVRLRVRAAPAESDALSPDSLAVRVNDVLDLAPVALTPGFRDYEWDVPDHAWVAGTNEVLFSVSRTQKSGARRLGLALASLDVR